MSATLFLMCGLPGAGKTTLSHELAADHGALRISSDEWLIDLLEGPHRELADPMRLQLEPLLLAVTVRILSLGGSVVLDFGSWHRAQRDRARAAGRVAGARVELHVLNPPLDVLRERVAARNAGLGTRTFQITDDEMVQWVDLFEVPTEQELTLFDPHVSPSWE
ncbi:AAA family ATPase [Catellatospora tritici]|uniref:AAA family ATPase n=1 Tax=Catellatospora tritici TaxID=2851566 RepID=UPI001C2D54E6|nr:AAA family ATPase [Catellatospora tritici]MBV1855949.1 AAA family ATPase [Catellatospora tritici]